MSDPTPQETPESDRPGLETPGDIATPEFIAALLVDGDDDLAAWAIGQALEERPRAEVYDDVIRNAMELVGDRWESGHWTVSHEHLATVALSAALARLRPADPAHLRAGPVALLAAPEGEEHVSGLTCLAQILEECGWRVENLGPNVPADDLLAFVAQREIDLIGLTVGTQGRLPALRRTIDLLRGHGGLRMPIMVGGHGTARLTEGLDGADFVTASLAEAQGFIEDLSRRHGATRRSDT
jgi:methanogenic corrinoid protein MtbC1